MKPKRLLLGMIISFLIFCVGYYSSFFIFVLNGINYPLAQGSALLCGMWFDLIPSIGIASWIFEI